MGLLRRVWSRPLVRWPLSIGYALALAAYLTLGNLHTLGDATAAIERRYVVISALAMALLVVAVGWHSIWLMIGSVAGFASTYETYFWTRPPGLDDSTDYVGYYPSGVVLALFLALPYAGLLAAVRARLTPRPVPEAPPPAPRQPRNRAEYLLENLDADQ